jgi:outer membrane protein TolC
MIGIRYPWSGMRSGLLTVCVLLGMWGPAVPPATSQLLRVTIEEVVGQTLLHNHELAAARMLMEDADALLTEAWGSALPKIDIDASYTRALKKPVFFLPGDFFGSPGTVRPVEIGSTNALLATLSANQVLFNGAVFVGVGAAGIYSRAAREQYRGTELEYITKARKAFYDVLVTKELLDLALETQNNVTENFRTVSLLAGQGLVSEYDQLRAEVTLENVKPDVIIAENSHRLALNSLKNIMALPNETELEVVGDLVFVPVPDSLLETARELMLEDNPILSALTYQTEFNDAVISGRKSEYLPVLSAFGNYQYQGQSNEFNTLTDDLIESSTVGLSLSVNIFNGFQTTARVERARIDYERSLEQLAGTRQALLTATEAVLLRLRKAQQRVEAGGRTVVQAERGYHIATTRYSSGLGTQLEVNDAQLALVRSRVNEIEAVYEYVVASAELDQLLGRVPDYVKEDEE